MKLEHINFDPLEFIASVVNIWRIFDENGISKNAKNKIFLTGALIAEMKSEGLSRDEMIFNFTQVLDLIEEKFKVNEYNGSSR